MSNFYSLFKLKSKSFYLGVFFVTFLNSALNSLLMITVSKSLMNSDFFFSKEYLSYVFAALLLFCIILNALFYSYIIKLSSSIIYETELKLITNIQSATFENINSFEREELLSGLKHIANLGDAPLRLISICNSTLTIIAVLTYLFYTSFIYGVVLTLLVSLLICLFVFRAKMRKAKYLEMRSYEIEYYKFISDLFSGFKEIKLSKTKSENIYAKYMIVNRNNTKTADVKLKHNMANSTMIGNYFWYGIVGIILFVIPVYSGLSLQYLSTFVLMLVYIITPVSNVTSFFSFYPSVIASSKALDLIYTKVACLPEDHVDESKECSDLEEFRTLRLDNTIFRFQNSDRLFQLGPINLTIKRNEIVFLIGGNGSGKSTLLYLIASLYKPTEGNIYYNSQILNPYNLRCYRSRIATVFIDGFIGNYNYDDIVLDSSNAEYIYYLRLFKIDGIMAVDEIFQSKNFLSKGQQKRLAFVLALLMNCDIILLDEWAAEQDSSFKDYFYRTILPIVKTKGKTIVSVTHEEKYLALADKIFNVAEGKITSINLSRSKKTVL